MRKMLPAGLMALSVCMLPTLGITAELNSGDTAWMLTATALVLMMTLPGLALFYGGLVRKMNVVNTLMQCFVICCLMSVLWFVAGYSIAFSETSLIPGIAGGLDNLFLQNMTLDSLSGTIPESVFMTFQMTFAIITPALIVGSFVERIKFSGLLVFMTLWLLAVYAPMAHMVWGGGIQAELGVLDFAGGNVVHINAAVAALIACLFIGKRKGYATATDGEFHPNNITYTMVGAALLWVGWFGFNAGSAVAANGAAGMAMAVTQIASATAALAWMFTEWLLKGKPTLVGLSCGAIAGLVAITPAAGFVNPMGAFYIGLAAGVVCLFASYYLKAALGYDDSLDVVGVHGFGGLVGALLLGLLADEAIGGVAGSMEQFMIQFQGVGITVAYCAVVTTVILLVTQALVGLRVPQAQEDTGLDLSTHGEKIAA